MPTAETRYLPSIVTDEQIDQADLNRQHSISLRVLNNLEHVIYESSKTPKRRINTLLGTFAGLGSIAILVGTKDTAAAATFSVVSSSAMGAPLGLYVNPARFIDWYNRQQSLTTLNQVPINPEKELEQRLTIFTSEFLSRFKSSIPGDELINWSKGRLGKDFVGERNKRFTAMDIIVDKVGKRKLGYRKRRSAARKIFSEAQRRAKVIQGTSSHINYELAKAVGNLATGSAFTTSLAVGLNERFHVPILNILGGYSDDLAIIAAAALAPVVAPPIKRFVEKLTPELRVKDPDPTVHDEPIEVGVVEMLDQHQATTVFQRDAARIPGKVHTNLQR